MTGELKEAATIAVVGVAVVMTALTILMVAIMVLTKLAPSKKEDEESALPTDVPEQELSKEGIAAMAVAMALAMRDKKASFSNECSSAITTGHAASRWASTGRERLMHSGRRPGRKR